MESFINKLNLSKKLFLSPFVTICFMIVLGLTGYWGLQSLHSSIERMHTVDMQSIKNNYSNFQNLTLVQGNIFKFITWARANYDPAKLDALSNDQIKKVDEIKASLELILKSAVGKENEELYKLAIVQIADYKKSMSLVLDFAQIDLNSATMAMGMVEDKHALLDKTLHTLTQQSVDISDKRFESANSTYSSVSLIFFVVFIGGIFLALIASSRINRSISKPLFALTDSSKRVTNGDYDVHLQVSSHDEIGSLTESFQHMIEKIKHSQEQLVNEKNSVENKVAEAVQDAQEHKEYLETSVSALLTAMNALAAGDMTAHVGSGKDDEIGKLFMGFNASINNIHSAFTSIVEAVEATASASAQISSSAEEMAAGAHEQSSQTSEIAAAVEEMTRTILDATKNASFAAEKSRSASANAREGAHKVEETMKGMNRIVESTRVTGNIISSLAKRTDQIGEITQVIDDIADQTNLLALNAAIEAARAGEQGRGFAVVADEVRKLAERTTKATKEIADTIKTVQREAQEADHSMTEAGQSVEEGLLLTKQVADSLTQILSVNDAVADLVNQVAASSEQQSATAEEISKNIDGINNVTQQSATGTSQIAHASEDLNRLTDNLQQLIGQFKLTDTGSTSLSNQNLLKRRT